METRNVNEVTFEWWLSAHKTAVSVSTLITGEGLFIESHAAFAKDKVSHVLMEDMKVTIFLPDNRLFHVQLNNRVQEDYFKMNHKAISEFYNDVRTAVYWQDDYNGHKKATVIDDKPGVQL